IQLHFLAAWRPINRGDGKVPMQKGLIAVLLCFVLVPGACQVDIPCTVHELKLLVAFFVRISDWANKSKEGLFCKQTGKTGILCNHWVVLSIGTAVGAYPLLHDQC